MKKLIAVFLALLLIIPAAVSADEPDPIIGCWYMCVDAKDTSQDYIDKGYIYSVALAVFTPGGQILCQNIDFKESSGTAGNVTYVGKWNREGDKYITSIIAAGENEALLSGNALAVCLFNSKQYVVLRRMDMFSMYNDIYRVQ